MNLRRSSVGILMLFHCALLGQGSNKAVHSWDIFMNDPEAKKEAETLIGHCGDARVQAVMNACFALEFRNADNEMNSTYQTVLSKLEAEERRQVRNAQRAWLRYRDLHCETVGLVQVGKGSLEPTEEFSCKADLTR